MAFTSGTRLSHYEIVAQIGAGGMGEVYQATDTNLKRQVAIKVLPATMAEDGERLARFRREAEVLAALNHPNIAQIHGLDTSDRALALVMELVEGPTLADRIERGPIPVQEALHLAAQIAKALEVAHDQGIIHRDLKPANIKIRTDGVVKVLDFGLAKAVAPAGPASLSTSQSPTMTTAGMTQAGLILGTAAYMPPEQARGEAVDQRADIWAFGCVLYEMLAGRRAFGRASMTETLAAVLEGTPDWSLVPTTVPVAVRRLLQRCLVRDRRHRIGHISTVLFVLEDEQALSAGLLPSIPVANGPSRVRSGMIGGAVALMASAVVAVSMRSGQAPPPAASIVQTTIPASVFVSGVDRAFAVTPDGSRLAYVSSDTGQILVRRLDALEATPLLTTPADLRGMFASPDSRWFGYVEDNFTLKKIAVTGGPQITILTTDGPSRGASWGPDDRIVFATGAPATGLQQVTATGGAATVLTRPDRQNGEADHVQPAWLPGGRRVLFTVTALSGGAASNKIAVLDLETRTWRTILDGGYSARYVTSGHLVYASVGALWAVPFDLERLEAKGTPAKLMSLTSLSLAAQLDITSAGMLVYPRGAPEVTNARRVPVWVDRQGRETPPLAPPGSYGHPRLSPDGRRLAVASRGDLYIWDLSRPWSTAGRLTFAAANDWFPVWTPDGRRVVFGSWRGGGFSNLYVQEPDTADAMRLTQSPDMQVPTSITPDGSTVIFHSYTKSLQAVPLQADGQPQKLVETPLEERNGDMSPDGRWLAYEGQSASSPGDLDVYVRSFPDVNRGLWQVSRGGGMYPTWSRDGRELFFVTLDGKMMTVPVAAAGSAWRAGSPVELFRGPYVVRGIEGSQGRNYEVSRDASRFLMLKETTDPTVGSAHFIVVQNWVNSLNPPVTPP